MLPQQGRKSNPQNSSPHASTSPHQRCLPLPNETDLRQTAYNEARRWACTPENWEASRHPDHVAAYLVRNFGRGELDAETLRQIARQVSERCAAELDSGERQASFAKLQGARGRASGEARRRRTAGRDAEIRRRVAAGESQRSVAKALGLSKCAVQNVVAGGWTTNQRLVFLKI